MGEIIASGLLITGGVYVILAIVVWILQIVANWKIFQKAGEAGWKSIIPIYSGYVSYRIAWSTGIFWLQFIFGFAANFVDNITTAENAGMAMLLLLAVLRVILAVILILYCIKLAKAFGKGVGFAIGLMLLSPIFLLILGFGSAQYVGPGGKKRE